MPLRLSDFIPPILYRKLNALRAGTSALQEFDNFDEASASLNTKGYNDDDISEVVLKKTLKGIKDLGQKIPDPQSVQNLYVINHVHSQVNRPLKVVDFGGACGYNGLLTNHFSPGIVASYQVIETPEMVSRGSELESDLLHFIDDLSKVESPCDIIIFSGVLQYLPSIEVFKDTLMKIKASWIYHTRTLFSENVDDNVVLCMESELKDHGPGRLEGIPDRKKKVPTVIRSKQTYLDYFSELGYGLHASFVEGGTSTIRTDKRTIALPAEGVLLKYEL